MITFKQFLNESDALRKYTSTDDFRYMKGKIADQFSHLKSKYPFSGGKIYRGLNFSSPKQYLQFRRSIRSGYVTSETISSWAPTQSTAKSFAVSPQVFIPTSSALAGYDPNERVSGFIGIILVTEVGPNIGVDVRKSKMGVEEEVILPAGRYKVVDIIIEKKWKHIVKKLDINQEVIDIISTKRTVDNELMRQLFRYKGGDLYPDVKRQIVEHAVSTFINKNIIKLELIKEPISKWAGNKVEYNLLFPGGTYNFMVYGSLGMLDFFFLEDAKSYVTTKQRTLIKTKIIDKINTATKIIDNKNVMIEYTNGFNHLCEMFDLKLTDFKYLSKAYANTYQHFNVLLRDWNQKRHFEVREMTELLRQSMRGPFR